MVTAFEEKGPSSVYAVSGNVEEKVFGIHVLVNQVHSPFLSGPALPLATLYEAGKLQTWSAFALKMAGGAGLRYARLCLA